MSPRCLPVFGLLLLVPAAALADPPEHPPERGLRVEQDAGEPVVVQQGEGSFYGGGFHGQRTASGERFDQNAATAASKTLPLGTKATVTNEDNGRSADVTINDRGPHVPDRIVDVSKETARRLGMTEDGTAAVRVEARPSDQPTAESREKLEDKAESLKAKGR